MKLTIENFDINKMDKSFYAYIIQHNKKFEHYLNKCQFKSVYQYCQFLESELSDNKTMICW